MNLDPLLDQLMHASPPLLVVVGREAAVSAALAMVSRARRWPLLHLSALLAEVLVAHAPRERQRMVVRLFRGLLPSSTAAPILLDRTALLFLPELMLNPLQLLVDASRLRGPLVVAWCGAWDGTCLTYARPEHPEYRRYLHPAALVVGLD